MPLDQVSLVWVRAHHHTRGRLPPPPASPTGHGLWAACELAGLCHAEVVVGMSRDTGPVAEGAIEALIGHPITRMVPSASVARAPRTPRLDPRTIVWVAPDNPKREGTRAHRVFAIYRVGMTVSEFLAAGGRASSVRYDTEHGYIRVEP